MPKKREGSNEILIAVVLVILLIAAGIKILNKEPSFNAKCINESCSIPDNIDVKWLYKNCNNISSELISLNSITAFPEWNCGTFLVKIEK